MRRGFGKPPPLSKVTEEMASPALKDAVIEPSKLVEVETPRDSEENKVGAKITTAARRESDLLKDKENEAPKLNGKQPETTDEAMKTIEI